MLFCEGWPLVLYFGYFIGYYRLVFTVTAKCRYGNGLIICMFKGYKSLSCRVLTQWQAKGKMYAHFESILFNIWNKLTDQHCEITRSQSPHPCIQNESRSDQGCLNMTNSLPLSESEKLKFSFSTSVLMEVECAEGKVETVNGTTDHTNTFLKSHFWHSQLETQPAWETLHIINISLMTSFAHNSQRRWRKSRNPFNNNKSIF